MSAGQAGDTLHFRGSHWLHTVPEAMDSFPLSATQARILTALDDWRVPGPAGASPRRPTIRVRMAPGPHIKKVRVLVQAGDPSTLGGPVLLFSLTSRGRLGDVLEHNSVNPANMAHHPRPRSGLDHLADIGWRWGFAGPGWRPSGRCVSFLHPYQSWPTNDAGQRVSRCVLEASYTGTGRHHFHFFEGQPQPRWRRGSLMIGADWKRVGVSMVVSSREAWLDQHIPNWVRRGTLPPECEDWCPKLPFDTKRDQSAQPSLPGIFAQDCPVFGYLDGETE